MKKSVIAILIALIAFGLFLRLYKLGAPSFWIDEGYTVNAALSVAEKGLPLLDSGRFYKNGPLETYLIALIPFDPYDPWPVRLPTALAGAALVFLVFWAAKELWRSDVIALASSAVIALSTWEIAWSRQARGYVLVSAFAVAAFVLLLRYLRGKRLKHILWSAAFLGLAYLSHGVALIFIPAWIIALMIDRLPAKRAYSLLSVLLPAVLAAAFIVFVRPDKIGARSLYFGFIVNDIFAFFLGSIIGFLVSATGREVRKESVILGVFALVPIAGVYAMSPTTEFRYLFPIFPFIAMLSAWALSDVVSIIMPKASRGAKVSAFAIVGFLILVPYATFAPKDFYKLEFVSLQPDFAAAFAHIRDHRTPGDLVISPYAQFHKIYLGEKGMWLAMNLLLKDPGEIERKTISGKDYYVGAPVVADTAALAALASKSHGYVVMDNMSRVRLKETMEWLASDPKVTLSFHSARGDSQDIWVYKF